MSVQILTAGGLINVATILDGSEHFQQIALADGAFDYASNTVAGTVDVPSAARLKRVCVLSGSTAATVTIGGGNTITVPAGGSFDEHIAGDAIGTDVVIGGGVISYYVAWVTGR